MLDYTSEEIPVDLAKPSPLRDDQGGLGAPCAASLGFERQLMPGRIALAFCCLGSRILNHFFEMWFEKWHHTILDLYELLNVALTAPKTLWPICARQAAVVKPT